MRTRRLFSTISKINCSSCKFYDNQTTLCRINNLNALSNRAHDTICGNDGKLYCKLDETNLIISEKYYKYSSLLSILSISSSIGIMYFNEYSLYLFPGMVLYSSYVFRLLGDEYKKKCDDRANNK